MLPDMADVLDEFSQPLILIRITENIVNFRPVEVETNVETDGVVQPARKEKINPAIINWSLKYQLVHSTQEILLNDRLEYCGIKYKCVELGDYADYGFYEGIFEEIK